MCRCHKLNKAKSKIERVENVLFPLDTGNNKDIFQFPHEDFKRQIIEIDFKAHETFAPPMDNYSGLDERGLHTFHNSFKAYWFNPNN